MPAKCAGCASGVSCVVVGVLDRACAGEGVPVGESALFPLTEEAVGTMHNLVQQACVGRLSSSGMPDSTPLHLVLVDICLIM